MQLSWEYPPLVYGGLGRHVHGLAEAQAAAGHEVTVVTQHVDGTAYDEVVGGVHVVRAPLDPPAVPPGDLLAWVLALGHAVVRAASRAAPDVRPEVVHAHDWPMAHAGAALKSSLGVPLVATVHATEAGRHQGWLPSDLSKAIHTTEWWLTYEARRVVTCSSAMRDEVARLFELPDGKTDVVPNGIDLAEWSVPRAARDAARAELAGHGPLLVFSGRLEHEKGLQTLLAAMPRLRRRFPGARLAVAGEGTYGPALRHEVAERRLGRAVSFVGFLPTSALAALVAAADCVVVPSSYEPFGLVALEAAAVGTPRVVAASGGLRDLVAHGRTGLLFAPGDAAALADAVTAVLADLLAARRMARAARAQVARDNDWSATADEVVAVYRRAVREERELRRLLGGDRGPALRAVVRDGNLLERPAATVDR